MADRGSLPDHSAIDAPTTEDQMVDEQCELLAALEKARKSRQHTVQAMPDGLEIIHVETGDLERKIRLVAVDA